MGEKIRPDKVSTEGGTCTAQAPPSAAAGPVFPSFFFGTSAENFRQSRAQTVNKNFRNCKVSCIDLRNKVI